MDLRGEPLVICVPKTDKSPTTRFGFSDLYSYNVGYIGSRATGNDGGCCLAAGPTWMGEMPKGIKGYSAQPLSTYLKQPAPPAAPAIDSPAFNGEEPFRL